MAAAIGLMSSDAAEAMLATPHYGVQRRSRDAGPYDGGFHAHRACMADAA